MAFEEKKFLGTAGVQQLITNTRTEISAAEQAAKDYADSLADNYDAVGTAATKVQELADGQVKTNKEAIGTMDNLETTAKGDLVTAINEVRNAVSVGGTAAAITMAEQTTGLGDGILKAYVLKQGENTVGTINIPKDMVVQSGEVVVNPDGQDEGTYIKLTLANATNDVIYVNVGTLVDIYKAKAEAAQVQVAIDSATREISATVVAGSITATELASDAVTTVKIADGNVTKAKLSSEVQASLDKADAAAQDATDKAAAAEAAAKEHATGLNTAMNTRVEALEAIDHEHANATQLATYDKTQAELLAAAKAEAEGLIGGVDLSGIATNASDIDKLEESLAEGGATANAIAAAHKAGTDASDHADELNTAMNTRVEALEAIDHEHANATQLATYDKTQADLLKAAATTAAGYAGQAESYCTQYTNDLRQEHGGRLDALEAVSYIEITASDINAMFTANE